MVLMGKQFKCNAMQCKIHTSSVNLMWVLEEVHVCGHFGLFHMEAIIKGLVFSQCFSYYPFPVYSTGNLTFLESGHHQSKTLGKLR